MKRSLLILSLSILFACALVAQSQEQQAAAGHFAKDGLSFDYPADWKLTDKSNEVAQQLILSREGNSALIMVVAHRDAVTNLQQFETARDSITTPYAENLALRLSIQKIPLWSESKCIDVGERFATGFKLAGRLDDLPSTGEVYAMVLGRRFINLVYIRNDKDDADAAPVWKRLLDTVKVEAPPGTEDIRNPAIISGGVLNNKAIKKPPPQYPPAAKAAGQQGTVVVQLTVDEAGNVTDANAVSGPPLLKAAAEKAALGAKFKPATICGHPVKVSGVVTYHFVLQFGVTVRP